MYLSKLEIFGFKSFANKTRFEFAEGLTGIVGPNGCGKSNIVDAIRWVLGEQKVSVLRSDKMENVIFNGTNKRKPLGMAEVSLTIENNKNILPTEFSEVVITRRLYRSGESQYLLNGQLVRLKDIQNLFLDTGMSPDAYSIIELKMIELILSDNKEERRRLFEEAAGIKKYKIHRRLALKKLDQTQIELNRVNDLLTEVQRNVNSLSRQVSKARKYKRLKEELRDKEIHLQLFRYFGYLDSKKPFVEELEELERIKKKTATHINQMESELEHVKLKTLDLEQEFQDLQREIAREKEQIDELEKQNLIAQQQIQHLEKEKERLQSEYHFVLQRIDEISALIEQKKEEREEIQDEFYHYETQLEEIEEEKRRKQSQLIELKDALQEQEQRSKNWTQQINALRDEYTRLESLSKSKFEEIKNITYGIEKDKNNYSEKEKKIKLTLDNINTQKQKLASVLSQASSLQDQKTQLENQLSKIVAQYNEIDKTVATLQNEISIYESIIKNYEGYSSAVKWVMKEFNQNGTLLETLPNTFQIKKEGRPYLAQFFSELSDVVVVPEVPLIEKIISRIQEEKVGQISILSNNEYSKKLPVPNNVECRPILDYVITDGDYSPFLQKIFQYVFATDSVKTAIKLHESYPHCTFIAPNGFISGPMSLIKSGSSNSQAVDLIGRKNKVQQLQLQLKTSLEERSRLREQKEEINLQMEELQGKIASLEKESEQLQKEIQQAQNQYSTEQAEFNALKNRIQEKEETLNELQRQIQSYQEKQKEIKPRLDQMMLDYDQYLDSIEELKKQISYAETDVQKISDEYNNKRIDKIKSENQLEQLQKDIFQLEKEFQELELKKERFEKEDEMALDQQIDALQKELDTRQHSIHELYQKYSKKVKVRDQQETEYQNLKNILLAKEDEIAQNRRRFYQSQERIKELEFKIQELDLKAQGIEEQLVEYYDYKIPQEFPSDMEHFNPEMVQEEIVRIKHNIEKMGEVNPLAEEEYQKEKERLDFLKSQQKDILDAERQLLQTIDELNKNATEKFLSTFEAIHSNFIKVFKEFFPLGEASLEMTDPSDPLETDINIRVTTKGRKLQTLSLMSAGEKTLTAISLLFAIYLVKPSPFCILDEVDAPLDDVNIGQFTQALRNFSKSTQFIVVTHNKRTMEAMDSIYGITMEEEGVSKVVSVQFK